MNCEMFWVTALVLFALCFYYFLYKPQLYWSSKNVLQGPAVPIFGDNLRLVLKQESFIDMVINVYKRFKDARYSGIYQTMLPTLLIRDPKLIRQLTIKDFDHFVDHRQVTPKHIEPMWGNNLLALTGDNWKQMRATLSPAFTSSKMRAMFLLMEISARQYVEYYMEKSENIIHVELKDSFGRFANDVFANCAYGMEVNSLKERDNEVYYHGRETTNLNKLRTNVVFWLNTVSPKITSAIKLRMFPKKSMDFFKNLSDEAIKYREQNNIVRPDVVHLLMEARKGNLKYDGSNTEKDAGFATAEESSYEKVVSKRMEFTDIQIAAQLYIFFFGGIDTLSTVMSMLCYNLTIHPEIQEKLRQEVDDVYTEHNGKLGYDILNSMKYLDMVVSENLRMYTPGIILDRVCSKEYTIQPERPGEEPVHLKPGDCLWIPVAGIHYDEKYYKNPKKFDPERFSDENKDTIQPYTYFPFGLGPRNCIGSRFALMEIKTLSFHILRRFELVVINKTTIPIELETGSVGINVKGGFWVGFKRRSNM